MNHPASTPPNRKASPEVTAAAASTGNNSHANQRLMKYLALLKAQESVPLEAMVSRSEHHQRHDRSKSHTQHNRDRHHQGITSSSNTRNSDELDNSIHKLIKSRRQDLRNAVKFIFPKSSNKKSTAAKPVAAESMIITVPAVVDPSSKQERRSSRSPKNYPKASEAAVTNLPRARLSPRDEDVMIAKDVSFTCAICAAGCFSNHHTLLARLPCGHVFHNTCAVRWLGQNCACPVCHYELETDDSLFEAGRRERMKDRKTITCSCPRTGLHECFFTSSASAIVPPQQFCKPTTKVPRVVAHRPDPKEDVTCSFHSDGYDASFGCDASFGEA